MARGDTPAAKQFGQAARGGHFAEVEIGEPADLARRHDQPAAMPAANHGHGDSQQLGQHRRRVKPMDVLLGIDQPSRCQN